MSFYSEGFQDTAAELKAKQDREEKMKARRIWVKPESHVDVLFLDEKAFAFKEHSFPVNGRWDNFLTCIPANMNKGPCPACQDGYKNSHVTMFSVIDFSKWQDKKGAIHTMEKKILAVRIDDANMLQQKKTNWGGLAHKVVRIHRKSKNSGYEFELLMRDGQPIKPDLSKIKDPQPFDYVKLFHPLSPDDMRIEVAKLRRQAASSAPVPTDSGNGWSSESPAASVGDTPPQLDDTNAIPF